ncbi:hypothetical protein [Priestia megaterium]|uniref:hypothetical protein n=1 Tax=Priestia megaterium TaxID=1404 RepID=UPI00203C89F7|nr:hypothetical protein [Priestia megaterium]MCM3195548.1 hypothetical protein [Priestia megaterium]
MNKKCTFYSYILLMHLKRTLRNQGCIKSCILYQDAHNNEKQQQADPLSPQNVQEKMKEGYEDYKQKQQQESAQNVDSILERVTAEEKYYLTKTKTQAIKNGWITKEEVVKLEHQIDSNIVKNEKGITNGQVQEQSLTFQDRFEVGNQMYPQKRTGIVKKKKEEQEIER